MAASQRFTSAEAEAWLSDVATVARESAGSQAGPDPIPPLLRNALTGLLFSHAELWERDAVGKPCSVAFVAVEEAIGFGIVGEPEIAMLLDGRPHEPAWIRVRDEQGREARAWKVPAGHAVQLRVVWTSVPGNLEAPAARLEADWVPSAPAPPRSVETVAHAERGATHAWPARVTPSLVPPSPPRVELPEQPSEPIPSEPFVPLSSRLEPDTPAVWDRRIPPSPEPAALTMRAVIPEVWAGPREIDLPPLASATAPPDLREAGPEPRSQPEPTPIQAEEPWSDEPILPAWLAGPAPPRESGGAAPEASWPAPDLERPPSAAGEPAAIPSSVSTGFEQQPWSPEPPLDSAETELLAPAAPVVETPRLPIQRPAWPSTHELERGTRRTRRVPWTWIGLGLALIGVGWLVGSFQDAGRPASLFGALGRALGFAGPHFTLEVTSTPEGASIAVDDKPLTERTPATIELPVGEHRVTVSAGDHGGAAFTVRGERKGERVPLTAVLWGALEVISPDPQALIAVAVDGAPRGFAPVRVDSLAPGAHDVRYSGPGMASWGQAVEIRARETREILARPLQSPASGMILVRAVSTEMGETQSVDGARVWVDGEPRGVTPLTLDLPRGPHSVRVVHRDRAAPVQVIDLPGGNQRFANFEFGAEADAPRLMLTAPERISTDHPTLISASLEGAAPGEVREMWLHVRTPEGPWRRYPMALIQSQGAAVGAFAFPVPMLGPQGRTSYYVSAVTGQGDEYFTELQVAQAEGRSRR